VVSQQALFHLSSSHAAPIGVVRVTRTNTGGPPRVHGGQAGREEENTDDRGLQSDDANSPHDARSTASVLCKG